MMNEKNPAGRNATETVTKGRRREEAELKNHTFCCKRRMNRHDSVEINCLQLDQGQGRREVDSKLEGTHTHSYLSS